MAKPRLAVLPFSAETANQRWLLTMAPPHSASLWLSHLLFARYRRWHEPTLVVRRHRDTIFSPVLSLGSWRSLTPPDHVTRDWPHPKLALASLLRQHTKKQLRTPMLVRGASCHYKLIHCGRPVYIC